MSIKELEAYRLNDWRAIAHRASIDASRILLILSFPWRCCTRTEPALGEGAKRKKLQQAEELSQVHIQVESYAITTVTST